VRPPDRGRRTDRESEWNTRRKVEASTEENLIAAVDVQTMHEVTCPDGLTVRLFEQKVVTMDQADAYAYRFDAMPSAKTVGFWLTVQNGTVTRAWWMWDFFKPEGNVKNFACGDGRDVRFDAMTAWGKPGTYRIDLRDLTKVTVKPARISFFKKFVDTHSYRPDETAAGRLMRSVTSVKAAKHGDLQASALASASSGAAATNGTNVVLTLAANNGDFSVYDLGLDVQALDGARLRRARRADAVGPQAEPVGRPRGERREDLFGHRVRDRAVTCCPSYRGEPRETAMTRRHGASHTGVVKASG
jgi:hypothetical protein